jgi:hypothetical protein
MRAHLFAKDELLMLAQFQQNVEDGKHFGCFGIRQELIQLTDQGVDFHPLSKFVHKNRQVSGVFGKTQICTIDESEEIICWSLKCKSLETQVDGVMQK